MASQQNVSTSQTEIPTKEEQKATLPIERTDQNIIRHERVSETSESQDSSWEDNLCQGISNITHDDIPQGFTKKMVVIVQNEAGIINFNTDNIHQISIATGGIVTCVAVVIGYKNRKIGKDGQSHPVGSLLLAHVDTYSHLSFITDRLEQIKRENPHFKEQDITIDVINNPNFYIAPPIEEYLQDNCSHIQNSKGKPCYDIRHSKNGTVLCQGMIQNDKIVYKLMTPKEEEVLHQLNYCTGNCNSASNLLKDYFIEAGRKAQLRESIHQVNSYLVHLEYRNWNKTDPYTGRKLDIIYSNDAWAESSAKLSSWCKKELKQLKKFQHDDKTLKDKVRNLHQKCYHRSLYLMPPIAQEQNVRECIDTIMSYWRSLELYLAQDGQ